MQKLIVLTSVMARLRNSRKMVTAQFGDRAQGHKPAVRWESRTTLKMGCAAGTSFKGLVNRSIVSLRGGTSWVAPFALLAGTTFLAFGQDAATIQKKLVADYPLTQPTAAFDDIVTAGAVVVLQKGPLMMVAVSNSVNPYAATYKDGKLQSGGAKAKRWGDKFSHLPGLSGVSGGGNAPQTRDFVVGEKMWVTKIDTRSDSVVFDLFTDAYNDVRYKTSVTFPFPKGSTPSADDVEKLVGEVFKVQPAEDAKGDAQQQQAPAQGQQQAASANGGANTAPAQTAQQQQPAAEAAPPPIAPPPPPPADPKTVSVGQTPDQVTAALGQPEKIVKLGTKQIYYYKDMKVIFVNGKVSDVQ